MGHPIQEKQHKIRFVSRTDAARHVSTTTEHCDRMYPVQTVLGKTARLYKRRKGNAL
jgi:hypothetical protein